jgi:tRNA threonylcarbamoyladenosine biosynthesis protein TsaB
MKQPFGVLQDYIGDTAWWAPKSFRDRIVPYLASTSMTLESEVDATLAGLVSLCCSLPSELPECPIVPFYLREVDAEINFPEASGHLSEALRRGQFR